VEAAQEEVTQVNCNDAVLLTRIAYHLGNRHVSLQIGDSWIRYQNDAVLDDMVKGLGGHPLNISMPFHPEAGAYHSHHQPHEHASSTEHSSHYE
jgi:urease accessory protein